MRPTVILDPSFRTLGEIFDDHTLGRLHDLAEVVWGRDEPMPTEAFLDVADTVDFIVFGGWRHGRRGLAATGPRLRGVLEVAGGHHHPDVDYRACLDRGLQIGSCAPAFGPGVAEMALALTLASRRGVVTADRAMRDGTERWIHEGNVDNNTLMGATVGFVGCGNLAACIQELLAPFAVRVLGFDPFLNPKQLQERGIEPVDLADLMDRADVIYVLAAPTPDNEHLVSAELLERLRPSDTLVLMSRAHLVDFDAMTTLVSDGRFRVALDVFPVEPAPADLPIRRADGAICVPHIAGSLPHTLHQIGRAVVDDIAAIVAGIPPTRMQYLTRDNAKGLLQ